MIESIRPMLGSNSNTIGLRYVYRRDDLDATVGSKSGIVKGRTGDLNGRSERELWEASEE